MSYSVPLPRVLLSPYIARTAYDEKQREMMHPPRHPLFDIGYVFIVRIFLEKQRVFKRNELINYFAIEFFGIG